MQGCLILFWNGCRFWCSHIRYPEYVLRVCASGNSVPVVAPCGLHYPLKGERSVFLWLRIKDLALMDTLCILFLYIILLIFYVLWFFFPLAWIVNDSSGGGRLFGSLLWAATSHLWSMIRQSRYGTAPTFIVFSWVLCRVRSQFNKPCDVQHWIRALTNLALFC